MVTRKWRCPIILERSFIGTSYRICLLRRCCVYGRYLCKERSTSRQDIRVRRFVISGLGSLRFFHDTDSDFFQMKSDIAGYYYTMPCPLFQIFFNLPALANLATVNANRLAILLIACRRQFFSPSKVHEYRTLSLLTDTATLPLEFILKPI